MTAKVGIVEREETVIARQGHGKHVSEVGDTEATVEYAVLSMREFVAHFRSNQSTRNAQQYTKRCFLCCPPTRLYGEDVHASKQWQLMVSRERS
jgi:hypothetical protein